MIEILTPKQVAQIFQIHEAVLQRWRTKKIGPDWVKIGPRRIGYRREAIDFFLNKNEVNITQP